MHSVAGASCTFLEMLAAYIGASSAPDKHTLGMVNGLIARHQKEGTYTEAQCVAVLQDTGGKVCIGVPGGSGPQSGR
jgi:hypothetical protein